MSVLKVETDDITSIIVVASPLGQAPILVIKKP